MESSVDMEDYQCLHVIGRGKGTEVWCARKKGDNWGKLFAIKIMQRDKKKKAFLARELKALRQMAEEPLIIQCHGASITPTHVNIIMDYAPGMDLFDLMKREDLSVSAIRFYMAELTIALDKVHRNDIVHQDVKPENVLLDEEGHLLLADFGMCHFLDSKKKQPWKVGSRIYMPIEALEPERKVWNCELARDCYSVGVIALQMVCGLNYLPYGEQILLESEEDPTMDEIEKNLLRGMKSGKANIPDTVEDDDLKDMLVQLLALDCRQRLGQYGAFELKGHRFFKDVDWKDVEAKRLEPPYNPAYSSET